MSSKEYKYLADTSRNNILGLFAKWMMQVQEEIINPHGETTNNIHIQAIRNTGYEYSEMLRMLSVASLDDWALTQLLNCILEFLRVMKYPKPEPEVLKFFYDRVLQAYAIATAYSSNEGQKVIYGFVRTLNENSTRVTHQTLVDDSYFSKADRLLKKRKKKKATFEDTEPEI